MDLVILVLVVALVGLLIYIITTQVPMPAGWANALQVLALVVIMLFVLTRFVNLPNVMPWTLREPLPETPDHRSRTDSAPRRRGPSHRASSTRRGGRRRSR